MANPGDFHDYCARCGKVVYYEDMKFLAEEWYCPECYEELTGGGSSRKEAKVLWVNEDDGYCD